MDAGTARRRSLSGGTQPTSITAGAGQSEAPTVSRILLGTQLRRLREGAGITREAAGHHIRASHAKISRLELGRVGFKERDVADLLTLYGVTDDVERTAILDLMRQANMRVWWQKHSDLLPNWFETYLRLEQVAKVVRTYQLQFVPGLLQTEEYARAIIGHGHSRSAEELNRRVELRLERQEMLYKPEAPHLWAVIDEAALRRPMGGRRLMRAQIEHLLLMMKRPNITVQVVPFRQGGHAAETGAFTILRFDGEDLPDVVYLEQLVSALYLDKREQVDRYLQTMTRLTGEAPTPDATVELLQRILEQT